MLAHIAMDNSIVICVLLNHVNKITRRGWMVVRKRLALLPFNWIEINESMGCKPLI